MPERKHWLTVRNEASEPAAEIHINGIVGETFWDPDAASAKQFQAQLRDIPKGRKVNLFINSQGGSVHDGLGIYNTIKERSEDFTAIIRGDAMSIASFIPLACSKVITPRTSAWMLHKPWTYADGNADGLRKSADMLDTYERAMVAGYVSATGKTAKEIEDALREETYLDGAQAVEWGLADELTEDEVTLAALDQRVISRIRRVPVAMGAYRPPQQQNTNNNTGTIMEPNNSTTPAAEASNPSEQKTPTKTEPRENVEASAAIIRQLNEVRAENEKIRAQLADEHKRRVRDAVSAECQRIGQADKIDSWTALAMSNPEVVDNLKAMASFVPGSEPVRGVITGGKDAIDIRAELRSPRERAKFDIQNFSDVVAAERHRARGMRGHAFAANTHSGLSTMLGTMISDGISTVLQQRCCALRALARDFGTDRMKPLTPVVFKQVQAGGAAVEDPTNFEDTTNFVGTIEPITITPNRCVVGAHLTAAELNSGLRLQDFYEIKGHELADKIMAKVAAVITTANFTATPFVSAAAAFSPSDMRTLNGRAKLFRKKALIVDGEYFSQLLPNTRDDFDVTQGGNWPGWDYVLLNTVWTGATANTVGFVLDPMRAIACVAGLPLLPSAGNSPINEITYTVPGIELAVSQNTWISTSTKTEWINWEVMFGAVKAETAAGIIIQSA